MRHYIHSLSHRAEFIIVVLVAFAAPFLKSTLTLLAPGSTAPIFEGGLYRLLIWESALLIALGSFLSARGWSLERLGFRPRRWDAPIAVGLVILFYVAYYAIGLIMVQIFPSMIVGSSSLLAPGLSLATVLTSSALNGLFEELFVCGYVITALKNSRSTLFAVSFSIGIRVAYHLYQGVLGVFSIVLAGLIFGCWFARTRRLWPAIVAHAIIDLVGLWSYVGR